MAPGGMGITRSKEDLANEVEQLRASSHKTDAKIRELNEEIAQLKKERKERLDEIDALKEALLSTQALLNIYLRQKAEG